MPSKQEIIAAIDAYMKESGALKSAWYVGIAADPRQRLFSEHLVNERTGTWVYREAESHLIAGELERAYHNLRCDGAPGGGDHKTVYVYAYLKAPGTDP